MKKYEALINKNQIKIRFKFVYSKYSRRFATFSKTNAVLHLYNNQKITFTTTTFFSKRKISLKRLSITL